MEPSHGDARDGEAGHQQVKEGAGAERSAAARQVWGCRKIFRKGLLNFILQTGHRAGLAESADAFSVRPPSHRPKAKDSPAAKSESWEAVCGARSQIVGEQSQDWRANAQRKPSRMRGW